MSLPGWEGVAVRQGGLLDTVAAFLASHGLTGVGWVLPVSVAIEWGRIVLAVRLALQVLTGFAIRRFAALIGLDRVGVFAAVLVELDDGFVGGTPGALVGAALLLLATERCIAARGVFALAAAFGTVAVLADNRVALLVMGLSLGWGVVRIATGLAGRRVAAVSRLLVGALLGLLISFPPLAFRLGGSLLSGAFGFGSLLPVVGSTEAELFRTAVRRPVLDALLPLVPALALAVLALIPRPVGRRAFPLRVVLGLASVLFATVPGAPGALRMPIALLAAIALDDARRGIASGLPARAAASFGTLLLAGLAVPSSAAGSDLVPIAVPAAASMLLVPFGRRPLASGAVTLGAALLGIAFAIFVPSGRPF